MQKHDFMKLEQELIRGLSVVNSHAGPSFGISASPTLKVTLTFEERSELATVRISAQEQSFNVDSPLVWQGVGLSNTTSFSLMVDIDQALHGPKAEPFIRDERALN